jgi:signal transduction histidine kinase
MPPFAKPLQAILSAPDRLLWAVRVRWLVIGGFLLLAVGAHALGLFVSLAPVFKAAAVGGALNAVNGWCVRRRRFVRQVVVGAVPLDHVLITYLVINSGGVQSPFMMLYVVQVLATAMLVDTLVAAGSAVSAILLWFVAVSAQASGYLPGAPLFPPGTAAAMARYHATWAAFLLYCLALLVYLGGYISARLQRSEHEREEKSRHLEDTLSSLHATHEELRAAYNRLKRTEGHLIQSEKMRSLGQLVAGVAHELNNPISFVSANVEHVRESMHRLQRALDAYACVPLPAEERTRLAALRAELHIDDTLADLPGLLDDIEEGTRRTTHIVNELRSFSRSNERELWQQADLHHGIDSTLALLAHRWKDRIAVHRDYCRLAAVECLPGYLNQVFMNLLANAADAIGDRAGNIWITTRAVQHGPDAEPQVQIAIRDDGPGMSTDVQARIFDPFFTTKAVGQGTGLGLSVSYEIVERHRGTLTVESAPGAGSTFTIMLPVRQPPEHHPATA